MSASKLLLTKDVLNLGRQGDIVTVKPGYARNFLLPGQMAVPATAGALRMQAKLQAERAKKAEADKAEAEQLKAKLEGFGTLTTVVKVDHDGHMYGSVSATDIIHLLEKQASIVLEKRFVQIKQAFKKVGEFPIHLRLNEGVTADITLVIEAENAIGNATQKA